MKITGEGGGGVPYERMASHRFSRVLVIKLRWPIFLFRLLS